MEVFLGLMLGLLCIISHFTPLAEAVPPAVVVGPCNNVTYFGNSIWVSDPPFRGTLRIFFSCASTYGFCVWTAVHPNILGPHEKAIYRFFYKFTLLLLAIFIPEGLLVFGIGQHLRSRKVRKTIERMMIKRSYVEEDGDHGGQSSTAENGVGEVEVELDMQEAYFIVMGGFLVAGDQDLASQENASSSGTLNRKNNRFSLKAQGFIYHLKKGDIPMVYSAPRVTLYRRFFHFFRKTTARRVAKLKYKRAIADKGKASFVAKMIAFWQALWLIVQIIARFQADLLVTLFEIHTGIQVVLTIILYFFWWDKPLDVNEPIQLPGAHTNEYIIKTSRYEENAYYYPSLCNDHFASVFSRACYGIISELKPDSGLESDSAESPESISPCTTCATNSEASPTATATPATTKGKISNIPTDSPHQQTKAEIPNKTAGLVEPGANEKSNLARVRPAIDKQLKGHQNNALFMVIEGLLVVFSGACHAAAWKTSFPTPTEATLWRISSIGMIVIPTMVILIAGPNGYEDYLIGALRRGQYDKGFGNIVSFARTQAQGAAKKRARQGHSNGQQSEHDGFWFWLHLCAMWSCLLLIIVYILCVLCLVVEACISLRNPPSKTFETPKWNDYWPHI